MLHIMLAQTTITELPSVDAKLYIIADENCTAPLSMWSLKDVETIFLPKKEMTPIMLALTIGKLIGTEKEVVLYGADSLTKHFAGVKVGNCTFSLAKAKKPSAKKTGKVAENQPEVKAAEEKQEAKPKRRKKSAEEMLSEIGFTDKAMVESIKVAIQHSSDAKIGLPVQLRMQFVLAGISEDAEEVSRKVEPVYERLKMSMES